MSSEYATARANRRLANLADPVVMLEVEGQRKWPTTVKEYAEMMDPSVPDHSRVEFTNRGDRKVVKYNFFKMTMGPQSLNFRSLSES